MKQLKEMSDGALEEEYRALRKDLKRRKRAPSYGDAHEMLRQDKVRCLRLKDELAYRGLLSEPSEETLRISQIEPAEILTFPPREMIPAHHEPRLQLMQMTG